VKGVTISRGPDVKRGPGNLENKRKIGYSNEILLFWAPNPQASRAPKFSGPKLAYSVCKKVILQVGRGPQTLVSRGPAGLSTPLSALVNFFKDSKIIPIKNLVEKVIEI
jgi:hypothetical protein